LRGPTPLGEWQAYMSLWTAWNPVRTVAPLLGSVLFAHRLRYG